MRSARGAQEPHPVRSAELREREGVEIRRAEHIIIRVGVRGVNPQSGHVIRGQRNIEPQITGRVSRGDGEIRRPAAKDVRAPRAVRPAAAWQRRPAG